MNQFVNLSVKDRKLFCSWGVFYL